MIYIDPPYNTKNDGFVYNDDFTSSTEQTLEELGSLKEYIDYIENIQGAKTGGWLSFMYPRLLLAKKLLKKKMVLFLYLLMIMPAASDLAPAYFPQWLKSFLYLRQRNI